MYRRMLALAVVALAALVFVMPSAAAWGKQPRGNQGGVVELLDLGGTDQMIDVGNDGFGPGDTMIISHVVEVTKGSWPGATGSLDASVLVLNSSGLASVTATMRLPAGSLAVSGQFSLESGPVAPFSVRGVSGAYSGLAGTMTVTSTGGPQLFSVTLSSTKQSPWGNQCGSSFKRRGTC